MSTFLEVFAFLEAHGALLVEIKNAIDNGVTEATLLQLVKDSMIAASDAEMHRELDPKT